MRTPDVVFARDAGANVDAPYAPAAGLRERDGDVCPLGVFQEDAGGPFVVDRDGHQHRFVAGGAESRRQAGR
jgi:hypothetical protein